MVHQKKKQLHPHEIPDEVKRSSGICWSLVLLQYIIVIRKRFLNAYDDEVMNSEALTKAIHLC